MIANITKKCIESMELFSTFSIDKYRLPFLVTGCISDNFISNPICRHQQAGLSR
jgi:hypothetical protein